MSIDSSSSNPRPETSKLQQRLVECYQRGVHLMRVEKDHDYAHTMFAECVLHDPANLPYVVALLQNLRFKFPTPKKQSLFKRGGNRALKQATDAKEWSKVFRFGVDSLKVNPWDTAALRAMAKACAHFHYNDAELAYLKQALEANPKAIEVNHHCAHTLARIGQFDQAIACWHRIETIRPGDKEAAQMISELNDKKQKYPGGRPPASDRTPKPEPAPTATAEAAAESMELTLSPRQALERAIAAEPHDVSNYLELADLLAQSEQFQEAEATLMRGTATCGEHPSLLDRLRDVQLLRSQHELAAVEARRQAELMRQKRPFRMPWLETFLALAALALIMQFFPPVASATWKTLDFRHWTRTGWFVANALALLVLLVIRFRPELHLLRMKRRQPVVRGKSTNRNG
jgi:uncharacterized protein (TIGR02996 family)